MGRTAWLMVILLILIGYFAISGGWKEFWQGEIINIKYQISNIKNKDAEKNDWVEKLQEGINRLIDGKRGVYGVYVLDLLTGESWGMNEEEEYLAASVIKVPLVAVLYAQAQKGEINLEQEITVQPADIQDYGTGVIRYQKPFRHYSLAELASLTIIESDNTAAHILSQIIGPKVFFYFEKWGLSKTDYVNNKTTAKQMADFFTALFHTELLNEKMTNKLLADLKRVKHNERIPKFLPEDLVIAHKEGTWTNHLADVGIVYAHKPYLIALFTKDIKEAEANEILPEISKIVYEVMK